MTPIQVAMCKVIKECGFEGLDKVKLNHVSIHRSPVIDWEAPNNGLLHCKAGAWTITLDGHELTQEEYEQWVKQND